ncbi:MAG TPA: ABC transporter substrate-binding protein [Candidatus Binatia bacterium]|nr:ABC transporter substrate-binding protein [Candidatus Binatia bacterium]
MNGKILVSLLSTLLLATAAAQAQPKAKVFKVGVLTPAERQWEGIAFREGLRDLGYVEGSNILIDVRSAEGQLERLPQLAAALIKSDVDLILAVNTPGTRAAMEATKAVPIVMTAIGDPVGLGLVTSLARPEGNVTGLSNMSGDLAGKRLELLKEAVPAARHIAVMMHPDDPIVPLQVKDINATAARIGVALEIIPVRHAHELEGAFQRALHWRAQGLLRLAGQATVIGPPTAELALKYRMPSMLLLRQDVEAGALMSYFSDHQALFRRAAMYVDRILKGAKPTELPVEQPTKFEFYVNLKTAKKISVTIPPNLLARADKVIR